MPFVSRDLMRLSLEALRQPYSPLLTVSVPCMLAKPIPTCLSASEARERAVAFGGRDEKAWLERYFKVPGGPRRKPYYMPGTGEWVEERYAERALQRRRKDFDGTVFFHPDASRWALTNEAASVLLDKVLVDRPRVPLVALMAWMWRDQEIDTITNSIERFVQTFGLDRDSMLEKVYDKAIPSNFEDAGLGALPLTSLELAELVGAVPPGPAAVTLDDVIPTLEGALKDAHFLAPEGLVSRIVGGWLVGDIVVLVGPTGSGKTSLARALAMGLERVFGKDRFISSFLEIAPEFDVAQFLGYENLAGEFTAGRFTNEVLFVGAASDPRLVVLDEWNLAQIDNYFAPILSVLESGESLHLPGRVALNLLDEDRRAELLRAQPSISVGEVILPENCFFLATCNSWADEPETRLPVSGPVKRRCRIIAMPNALLTAYLEKKQQGIIDACDELIRQAIGELNARQVSGHANVWDTHRSESLAAVPAFDALAGETRGTLLQVCKILLESPFTREAFTLGLLRDVLLSCIYAKGGQQLLALGEQIADKILHQIRGEPRLLELITEATRDLPNGSQITELARRMGAFTGERRIRPLL